MNRILIISLVLIKLAMTIPSHYFNDNSPYKINLVHNQTKHQSNSVKNSNFLAQQIFPINQQNSMLAFLPSIPYPIQQKTMTPSGEIIIENLIGGLRFNCINKPTGHFRDTFFCDVFHACVHGQQRKTYACPFVGELVFFDDRSRRCEFVRNNAYGCLNNNYLNFY
ncbi:hypothetical protein BpHYR1_031204 [Brachionus plicatilis]|uniref:Chitin-binding type-2 domain-containing protein n=1 Tax=Brachionus plicatilis TaxID=10195 RepID=A0A3M7Q8N6_BRAPC|nr:hypothetical protein BpHYR1_031204 [Brachionus plicatilis]